MFCTHSYPSSLIKVYQYYETLCRLINTNSDKLLELMRAQGLLRPRDLATLGLPRVVLTRAVQRVQDAR